MDKLIELSFEFCAETGKEPLAGCKQRGCYNQAVNIKDIKKFFQHKVTENEKRMMRIEDGKHLREKEFSSILYFAEEIGKAKAEFIKLQNINRFIKEEILDE